MIDEHTKFIGVGGVARSGKDTFADKLAEIILDNNPNYQVKRVALADQLKADLAIFVEEKFGWDIFKLEPQQKELIRPLLVAYGKVQRERTDGRYWIDSLMNRLKNDMLTYDYVIVSDIRYAEKKADECQWILNEVNGFLVHVRRYQSHTELVDGDRLKKTKYWINPPNAEERANDPKVRKLANYQITWDTYLGRDFDEQVEADVEEFYFKNIKLFI